MRVPGEGHSRPWSGTAERRGWLELREQAGGQRVRGPGHSRDFGFDSGGGRREPLEGLKQRSGIFYKGPSAQWTEEHIGH